MNKSYLEILQFFMKLINGGKLKEAMGLVEHISDDLSKLLAIFMPEAQVAPLTQQVVAEPTDEERALENQLALAIQGHDHPSTPSSQTAFDFSKIRKAIAFLKATGLLDLLMNAVLSGTLGGLAPQSIENPTTVESSVPPHDLNKPKT